jgi:hypothetical protein
LWYPIAQPKPLTEPVSDSDIECLCMVFLPETSGDPIVPGETCAPKVAFVHRGGMKALGF